MYLLTGSPGRPRAPTSPSAPLKEKKRKGGIKHKADLEVLLHINLGPILDYLPSLHLLLILLEGLGHHRYPTKIITHSETRFHTLAQSKRIMA